MTPRRLSPSASAWAVPAAVLMLVLSLGSCSGGGEGTGGAGAARTGTPAYYFQNAREAYSRSDFPKALDWLDKVTKANKNEFTDRAWAFKLVLQAGLIGGYKDLAEHYEYGQRANKSNRTPFIKKVTEYRGAATRMTLPFGENYAEYLKNGPGAEALLDFPFPATGSTAKPTLLNSIAQGIAQNEEKDLAVQKSMIARGIVLALCEAVGAKEDAAKGRAAMQATPVKLPRAAFEMMLAKALLSAAQLHGEKLSGNPAVQEFLAKQAQVAMSAVTDASSKDAKDLNASIAKELKDAVKRKG
ncbi:MAG: hypothetical protein IT162_21355 [Bryobacterales bacterium]|nr:hypothetical protein [Bryobacterales bacterium]